MVTEAALLCAGRIQGAWGVKGWVKLISHTRPPENLLKYKPWHMSEGAGASTVRVLEGRVHGASLVVRMEGVDTREHAEALRGRLLYVTRDCLPPPALGEYYRVDLIGMRVEGLDGFEFGRVVDVMETGANDVLIVEGNDKEYLIPFVQNRYVKHVDIQAGFIRVDWDPDF